MENIRTPFQRAIERRMEKEKALNICYLSLLQCAEQQPANIELEQGIAQIQEQIGENAREIAVLVGELLGDTNLQLALDLWK